MNEWIQAPVEICMQLGPQRGLNQGFCLPVLIRLISPSKFLFFFLLYIICQQSGLQKWIMGLAVRTILCNHTVLLWGGEISVPSNLQKAELTTIHYSYSWGLVLSTVVYGQNYRISKFSLLWSLSWEINLKGLRGQIYGNQNQTRCLRQKPHVCVSSVHYSTVLVCGLN